MQIKIPKGEIKMTKYESYKILTAQEIENLRKEHGEKVEKVLEAGKGDGCMIAIVNKPEGILDKRQHIIEWEAMKALSPLSHEESIRIMDAMMLDEKTILVCVWQGETIYSIREKRAAAEAAAQK